jgi:hypothetical protein
MSHGPQKQKRVWPPPSPQPRHTSLSELRCKDFCMSRSSQKISATISVFCKAGQCRVWRWMKVKECVGLGSALRRKTLVKGLEQPRCSYVAVWSINPVPAAGLRRASQNPGRLLAPIDTSLVLFSWGWHLPVPIFLLGKKWGSFLVETSQ